MEQQNNSKVYAGKLLSNARAIISNQIAMPLGVRKMTKLYFAHRSTFDSLNLDLSIFQRFEDEQTEIPIGTERLLWEKEALKKQDTKLIQIEAKYRDAIIDKCYELIKLLEHPN